MDVNQTTLERYEHLVKTIDLAQEAVVQVGVMVYKMETDDKGEKEKKKIDEGLKLVYSVLEMFKKNAEEIKKDYETVKESGVIH